MNQAIKEQWLAALRSGEYTQTEAELHHGNSYCCLGVLCDLHAKAGLGQWDGERYFGSADLLPEEVCVWASIDGCPGVNGAPLVDLNDGINGYEQRTFVEIADLIEAHL